MLLKPCFHLRLNRILETSSIVRGSSILWHFRHLLTSITENLLLFFLLLPSLFPSLGFEAESREDPILLATADLPAKQEAAYLNTLQRDENSTQDHFHMGSLTSL